MPKPIHRTSRSTNAHHRGRHRHEHWLVDNQVYFITARCRDRFPAFAGEDAKNIFWNRFDYYTNEFGFVPWITSLLDNHFHTLGYLRHGESLPSMMQRIHGSVRNWSMTGSRRGLRLSGETQKAANTSMAAFAMNGKQDSLIVTL
jgi:REP element-mobilizing transposase RayT